MEYRITCIFKAVDEDSVAVTHVGGVDGDGERWKMSIDEANEMAAAGEAVFLLEAETLSVIAPDSTRLLKLPSCP